MNKIKLSPEQEAFAREIGATHCLMQVSEITLFAKLINNYFSWTTDGDHWIETELLRDFPKNFKEIDFTSEQEPDWKAVAQDLIAALTEASGALNSVITSDDREVIIDDDVCYAQREEWCDWVKNEVAPLVSDAIQRAKEAGL